MCAIFGVLGSSHHLLDKYAKQVHASLHHRGPDDTGFEKGKNYSIGFNRLSILDLSLNGHQPMFDRSRRYLLVFNGEIYNYKELIKSDLHDIVFFSHSDTEVLLNLLIKYKEDAIPKLNGMFAFCFIDTESGECIMGRDRFGIKPLYFSVQQDSLFFTSELKGLREIDELNWEIDETSLFEYVGIGYVNERSIYSEWSKVPPASYIKFNYHVPNITYSVENYWSLSFDNTYEGSYENAKYELEELLIDAVAIRLRSDVPLGVFLSGGIDSGLVAAVAQQIQPVSCYTVSYPDSGLDESNLAASTAKHIGAEQQTIQLKAIETPHLEELTRVYDEPFSDSSALPSFQICKSGADRATVFLTGDAGDEAFAGYKRYINRLNHNWILKSLGFLRYLDGLQYHVPLKYATKLHKLVSQTAIRDAYYDGIPADPWQTSLFKNEHRYSFISSFGEMLERTNNVTLKQQIFDYKDYLPNDILVKMDRASMANSIEVRSPFLDYRLHELAAKLPRNWLVDNRSGKKILRELSRKYLPEEVSNARKRGFGIPISDWTRDHTFLNNLLEKSMNSSLFEKYFEESSLKKIIDLHQTNQINGGALIWRISMLLAWERKYYC